VSEQAHHDAQRAHDADLIRRAAAQDQSAFAQLYDRLSGPLYGLCLRVLGNPVDAQDALQDAMIQLWRKAGTYDPELSSVFTWAVRVTRSRAIDRMRARARRKDSQPLEESDLHEQRGPDDDASVTLQSRESAVAVRECLARLPVEQRSVMELAFYYDLSHQEVADRMSLPLGTVKSRIRRGLTQLRGLIRATGGSV
jgi:RNA polymerase sigma-70 factor (ECF subfamily)